METLQIIPLHPPNGKYKQNGDIKGESTFQYLANVDSDNNYNLSW